MPRKIRQTETRRQARTPRRRRLPFIGLYLAVLTVAVVSIRFPIGDSTADTGQTEQRVLEQLISPAQLSLGHWQVPGARLALTQSSVSAAEVDERLAAIVSVRTHDDAAVSGELPEAWQELISQSNGLQPTTIHGRTHYQIDEPTFKARFVTKQVDGRDHVVAGAVAVASTDDLWQLTDVRTAHAAHSANEHLLVLPKSARRSLARFSQAQRLSAELIDLKSFGPSLLALWKQDGWQIRHSGFGGPQDFSYLCVRDNETIYAWSDDSSAAITRLMLVRTST